MTRARVGWRQGLTAATLPNSGHDCVTTVVNAQNEGRGTWTNKFTTRNIPRAIGRVRKQLARVGMLGQRMLSDVALQYIWVPGGLPVLCKEEVNKHMLPKNMPLS